ncbi:hypothetical protein [Methylobacterium sp. JK268]
MTPTRPLLVAVLLGFAGPALAGTAMPQPFRMVTALGVTKPVGSPLDARAGTRPDLDRRSREIDRIIATAICRGC